MEQPVAFEGIRRKASGCPAVSRAKWLTVSLMGLGTQIGVLWKVDSNLI